MRNASSSSSENDCMVGLAEGLCPSELAWNGRAKEHGCLHTSAFGNSADARAEEASKRVGREHPTVLEASIQVRLDGKEFSRMFSAVLF